MKIKRMSAADRDKQLELAIRRIERGRAHAKAITDAGFPATAKAHDE